MVCRTELLEAYRHRGSFVGSVANGMHHFQAPKAEQTNKQTNEQTKTEKKEKGKILPSGQP